MANYILKYPLITLTCTIAHVVAFELYRYKIPNGLKVPHPCNASVIWKGVGHQNALGGETANYFGIQFAENDYIWNRKFCQSDSDFDGKTNGEELGDPYCTWVYNKANPMKPRYETNITHPGVCDPLNSTICSGKNLWLECNAEPFCVHTNKSEVKNILLKFPRTQIPQQANSFYCHYFDLPSDGLYDVIADEHVIINRMVTHSLILFGCEKPIDLGPNDTRMWQCDTPYRPECTQIISIWSGASGDSCYSPEYGIRIGKGANNVTGLRYALLQIHWTNLAQQSNLYGSPGMRLFYTPILRPNKVQIVMLSQDNFFLPPLLKTISANAACAPSCTHNTLTSGILINKFFLSMHRLGTAFSLEQYRDGKLNETIVDQYQYQQSSPFLYELDPPFEFLPGDALKLTCFYNTKEMQAITYANESVKDETCIAFLVYYTNDEGNVLSRCGQNSHIPLCQEEVNDVDHICDHNSGFRAGALVRKYCNSSCTYRCIDALDKYETTNCSYNEAYDYYALREETYRITSYLYEYCRLAKTPGCDIVKSTNLSFVILKECDFNCTNDCVKLLKELRAAGCLNIGWRFFTTLSRILVSYSMSCDQYVEPVRAEGSINKFFISMPTYVLIRSLFFAYCNYL